jgi:prepilin-type N-terminal cleavage/methylation domain-containing protein
MHSVRRGFTLIELMVVMVITVIIMGMLTSIFVSATKVVTVVELKLRLAEQARGILDTFEQQIITASADERGGQFVIKGVTFTDNDPDPKVSSNTNSAASIRMADAFCYSQTGCSGVKWQRKGPVKGGFVTPMYQTYAGSNSHEYAMNSFYSKIHYPFPAVPFRSGTGGTSSYYAITTPGDQTTVNNDVSRLTYALYKKEMSRSPWTYGKLFDKTSGVQVSWYFRPSDLVTHPLEPGYEIGAPNLPGGVMGGGYGGIASAYYFEDIHLMDVSFAAWDETDRKFHRVPHLHAVYFAPMPKAILVTITVCDVYKKGRITYSRVILIPSGTGNGHFDATLANADTGAGAKTLAANILTKNPAEIVDGNGNYKLEPAEIVTSLLSLPRPYNRLKQLRVNASTPGPDDYDPAFLDSKYFK